ncbi:MAG: DUF882 domain-containing protein [Anderseniella sp.]|nr:DUF882 domain-containing protein [Anderseniella sp.]
MKRGLLGGCFAAILGAAVMTSGAASASAETRTLSMYFTHTKESITVTYKRNGKHDREALKKINWFLRDWRRDEPTNMSVETLDLLWELHADLGSKKPIHIVSAYRSPRTNAMLRRIGRKVATKSQHMRGNAIDFYFPDVPAEKIMGSALVRKVGGVGFYPRSGKYGFVHIDNGNVRHWPRMSPSRYASISRKYAGTVNARRGGVGNTLLAARETGNSSKVASYQAPVQEQEENEAPSGPVDLIQASMADAVLAAMSKSTPPSPSADEAPQQVANLRAVPKPRPKPIEVLMLAAANMKIEPASAPVPTSQNFNVAASESPVRGNLGPATIASIAYEDRSTLLASNTTAKGSLDNATRVEEGELRPLSVTYANTTSLSDLFANTDALARRDGAPQPFVRDEANQVPALDSDEKSALSKLIAAFMGSDEEEVAEPADAGGVNRSAKGDSQVVNRTGKGHFQKAPISWQQSDARATEVLKVVEAPLTFGNGNQ